MRASRYLIATQKETPSDAEIISHQLMLRAGMIRKLAAGLYTWLPLGLRTLRKVERIVREEMDKSGAQEVLMPAVQPAELWQESGRWEQYGGELLRLNDRHGRDFCFGPTHEEVITDLIRNELKSYKELPANFYQIQTKFRDERRPRFGVMRAREFIMKDAYSFHLNAESLDETYKVMHQTYCNIFDRLGLDYLLQAVATIRDDYPKLKLIVLGKLKEDGETARLIDRLGIRDLITFYSGLSSDEVAALYARATCAVIPSIYEGFGLPAGEAMACRVPVISTTGGALPEVVGDAGLMVPTADHRAIAAALRRYLDDPDLRHTNARKGFDRIQQQFSWEVAASEMAELYHNIIVEAH